jgi:aminopeptidase N
LGNFYPIACVYEGDEGFVECTYTQEGDPFYSVCADYTVHIELPQGFTVAASGTLDQSFEVGERLKQTYTLKNARDFSLVFSKNFSCLTSTVGDVEINYYYYNDESPQTNLAAACESLKYFSETFGNYAYSTLAIVQTGFCYGGMEYPALCMVSDSLDSDSSLYTIVHEVAHQWWYAGVGSDQISNAWQDEGLAEYSALLFFEHNPAYSFTRTGLVGTATKAYRAYFSVYNQLFGKVDTTMNRPLSAYSGEYEYVNIAYNKGLLLFDYLRQSIGDSKFLAALADYYQTYLYRIATPDDLIDCFVQKGGDLIGFFDSFIDGKIIL